MWTTRFQNLSGFYPKFCHFWENFVENMGLDNFSIGPRIENSFCSSKFGELGFIQNAELHGISVLHKKILSKFRETTPNVTSLHSPRSLRCCPGGIWIWQWMTYPAGGCALGRGALAVTGCCSPSFPWRSSIPADAGAPLCPRSGQARKPTDGSQVWSLSSLKWVANFLSTSWIKSPPLPCS